MVQRATALGRRACGAADVSKAGRRQQRRVVCHKPSGSALSHRPTARGAACRIRSDGCSIIADPVLTRDPSPVIRSILVPLDGSQFSEHAIAPAVGIAHRARAAIRLALVHEPLAVPVPTQPAPVLMEPVRTVPVAYARLDEEVRAQRLTYLRSLAQRLRDDFGLGISTAMLDGPVADTLATHAVDSGADLVVMTTHGRGGLSRLWLGSVAEGVVREATVPVLVVRPAEAAGESAAGAVTPQPLRRVLVPLDGSALAESILGPAVDVVGEQGECALVGVVEPITAIPAPNLAAAVPPPPDDSESRALLVGDYLESAAASLRARGLTVSTHAIIHPQVSRAILERAREFGPDLIAMATHGRAGLRRFFLGSVADKVLRGAEIPVLLYRPADE
jgi:nucleotide-binding universal stress UspA family protein